MVERRQAQRSLVRASVRVHVEPRFDLPPSIAPSIERVEPIAEARRKSNGPLPLIVLLGLLVAMLGYTALSAALPPKTAPLTFFGLSVTHTDTGLRLHWNPSAAALRGVTEAELTIADGEHRSQLLLSPGQIRSGNLFYTPFTGEVRFNLRAQGGNRVANEAVLALDAKAGESTSLQGAVTLPAAAWPDLMSNLAAAKPAQKDKQPH